MTSQCRGRMAGVLASFSLACGSRRWVLAVAQGIRLAFPRVLACRLAYQTTVRRILRDDDLDELQGEAIPRPVFGGRQAESA